MKTKKQGWVIIFSQKHKNTWSILTEDIFTSKEDAQKYLETGDWFIRTPCLEFNIIKIEWEEEDLIMKQTDNTQLSLTDGVYIIYENGDYIMVNPKKDMDLKDKVAYVGIVSGGIRMAIALRDAAAEPVTLTDGSGRCVFKVTDFRPDYEDAVQDWAGRENTCRLQKEGLNPAIQLKAEEYIPSLAQLYIMCLNRKAINEALELAGGEPLTNDRFWSSTEYRARIAWGLYFSNGCAYGYLKVIHDSRVRPVSDFPI